MHQEVKGCHHLRVVSLFSQTGGPGGFDLAGLLNNPGFMSMVNSAADQSQAISALCWPVQDEICQYGVWGAAGLLQQICFHFIPRLQCCCEETVLVFH